MDDDSGLSWFEDAGFTKDSNALTLPAGKLVGLSLFFGVLQDCGDSLVASIRMTGYAGVIDKGWRVLFRLPEEPCCPFPILRTPESVWLIFQFEPEIHETARNRLCNLDRSSPAFSDTAASLVSALRRPDSHGLPGIG